MLVVKAWKQRRAFEEGRCIHRVSRNVSSLGPSTPSLRESMRRETCLVSIDDGLLGLRKAGNSLLSSPAGIYIGSAVQTRRPQRRWLTRRSQFYDLQVISSLFLCKHVLHQGSTSRQSSDGYQKRGFPALCACFVLPNCSLSHAMMLY